MTIFFRGVQTTNQKTSNDFGTIMSYAKQAPQWKMVFVLDMDGHGGFRSHMVSWLFQSEVTGADAFPMRDGQTNSTCSISWYLKYLQVIISTRHVLNTVTVYKYI